jgi:hypothetical protein
VRLAACEQQIATLQQRLASLEQAYSEQLARGEQVLRERDARLHDLEKGRAQISPCTGTERTQQAA